MWIGNSWTSSVATCCFIKWTWTLGLFIPKLLGRQICCKGFRRFLYTFDAKSRGKKMTWGRWRHEQQVRSGRKERKPRDWQRRCSLYWTGVPLPWQPAALDWYLEQQVELLQRIWCSVHIWGQLIWRYTPLHFQSLVWDTAAGTRATGGEISHWAPD